MRRLATTFLLVAGTACLAAIPTANAQQLLLDYLGFDYEWPIAVSNTFGGVGNGYNGLGELAVIAPPLASDFANFQYTYFITGLTAATRVVINNVAIIDYPGPGTLTVYEDAIGPGSPFDYGTGPPNLTAPLTFTDGTPILVGKVTNLRYILNLASGSGSYDSDFEVVGGSQYLSIPANQRLGWQFAGTTQNTISIPAGYAHQVKGELYFGCAETDIYAPRETIEKLQASMKGANAEVEIYPGTHHGFTFPKRPVYDRDAAERHWERLLALYKRNLTS